MFVCNIFVNTYTLSETVALTQRQDIIADTLILVLFTLIFGPKTQAIALWIWH